MLSEKAKGKQRAVSPAPPKNTKKKSPSPTAQENELHVAEPEIFTREMVIRFTEGIDDLTVEVTDKDAVRDVKKMIRTARPQLARRKLRLVHCGRLLTNGTFLYSWLVTLEERQRRAVPDAAAATSSSASATTWLHCSVGPAMQADENDSDDEKTQTAQLQPARGFDRLSQVGFSESDIANFRRQFHNQSSADYLDAEFETEEEYDEHARALEEQWIDSLDNAGTASLSQSTSTSSSNSSILQGIIVGFFFPLLPLFFMRKSRPAVFWDDGSEHEPASNVIFSKRMQMGLVIGFLLNVLFGLWRLILDSHS